MCNITIDNKLFPNNNPQINIHPIGTFRGQHLVIDFQISHKNYIPLIAVSQIIAKNKSFCISLKVTNINYFSDCVRIFQRCIFRIPLFITKSNKISGNLSTNANEHKITRNDCIK